MDRGPVWLCGDFNLAPTKLDDKLSSIGHHLKRIPFTGEYRSFRRWDSVNEHLQRSSLDHLVFNSTGESSCALAEDGWFSLDHIPVVVYAGIYSDQKTIPPTELKRNASLNCNDRGACRRFLSEMDNLFVEWMEESLIFPCKTSRTNRSKLLMRSTGEETGKDLFLSGPPSLTYSTFGSLLLAQLSERALKVISLISNPLSSDSEGMRWRSR